MRFEARGAETFGSLREDLGTYVQERGSAWEVFEEDGESISFEFPRKKSFTPNVDL
jgi:hypothetical protein